MYNYEASVRIDYVNNYLLCIIDMADNANRRYKPNERIQQYAYEIERLCQI